MFLCSFIVKAPLSWLVLVLEILLLFLFLLETTNVEVEAIGSDEYDVIHLDTWSPTGSSNEDKIGGTGNIGVYTGPDHCKNVNVPPCPRKEPRDIVFLLDASNSVDREDFFTKTLDVTRDLICAFDQKAGNQFGLVIFNSEVREVIKLAPYSHQEWEQQIEMVRSNATNCCSCCTPLAEAFELSSKILQERGKNGWSIVYTQTDGVPYQNSGKGSGKYGFPKMNPAEYAMTQVPKSALALKQAGTRVIIVGVRTRAENDPNCDYFKGIPNKDLRNGHGNKNMQCITRSGVDGVNCVEMKRPPFPIVSEPVEKNSFCLTSIDSILQETVTSICLPPESESPTLRPTDNPSLRPTRLPTSSPTRKPSQAPTRRPTQDPSKLPTVRPTKLPTRNPTKNPTTVGPTRSPTSSPSLRPSNNPTASPTTNPTVRPSTSPTISPTALPTTPLPTTSPTIKPRFDSLDLYVVLDKSGSMDDYTTFCSKVARRTYFSSPIPQKSCWGLLLDFAETASLALTEVGAQRAMKWRSDWPSNMKNAGLRVTVMSFSCQPDNKTPITTMIVDRAESYQALQEGLIKGFQQLNVNGGTCPSEAIDTVVRMVEDTDHVARPFKTMIYLSDGITTTSNQGKTMNAVKGLRYFDISTFVIGIGVAKDSRTFGLTPEEIAKQKEQLLAIAGGEPNNVIGLYGDNAFLALSKIVQDMSVKITNDADATEKFITPYCGYTVRPFCVQNAATCVWSGTFCNYKVITGSPTIPTQAPTQGTGVPSTPSLVPTFSPSQLPTYPTNTPTTPTFSPTRRPKNSTPSPTLSPTTLSSPSTPTKKPTSKPSLKPTIKPTAQPTDEPTPQSGTYNPTRRPTLSPTSPATQESCKWPLSIGGKLIIDGASEAAPDELCSQRINKFGCSFKNYCCWDDTTDTCSTPNKCDVECPTITDQYTCSKKVGCCSWNAELEVCRRVCSGSPETRCPGMFVGNVKSTPNPGTDQPTVTKTGTILFPPEFN